MENISGVAAAAAEMKRLLHKVIFSLDIPQAADAAAEYRRRSPMSDRSKFDIELPQSIIDSFARHLVSEIRTYYDSEGLGGIRGEAEAAGRQPRHLRRQKESQGFYNLDSLFLF